MARTPGYNHVALGPINLGYVRAFNEGDLIPDTTVAADGVGATWVDEGLAAPLPPEDDDSPEFDVVAAQAALQSLGAAPSAPAAQVDAAAELTAQAVESAQGGPADEGDTSDTVSTRKGR